MEQNNFEKNMQQKMDELKIAPSESVWTNVEKRIGKKDKDRKLIFMLFLLIVFLLSGGYWLMNSSKNNQNNNHQVGNVIKNESSSKGRNNEDSSFAKPGIILQNKPENLIIHCGSGVTACHTILALAHAGFKIPNLYVGSWSEWSRREGKEIAKEL